MAGRAHSDSWLIRWCYCHNVHLLVTTDSRLGAGDDLHGRFGLDLVMLEIKLARPPLQLVSLLTTGFGVKFHQRSKVRHFLLFCSFAFLILKFFFFFFSIIPRILWHGVRFHLKFSFRQKDPKRCYHDIGMNAMVAYGILYFNRWQSYEHSCSRDQHGHSTTIQWQGMALLEFLVFDLFVSSRLNKKQQ